MKSRDIGLAIFIGVGVTVVELFLVGQLNHFNAPDLSLSTPIEAPAVIVHRPLPSPKELSRVETATETHARQAAAQTADLKMSALPAFKDAHSDLGLLSVLPGLGGAAMAWPSPLDFIQVFDTVGLDDDILCPLPPCCCCNMPIPFMHFAL